MEDEGESCAFQHVGMCFRVYLHIKRRAAGTGCFPDPLICQLFLFDLIKELVE